MSDSLFSRVIVPVASKDDARATTRALASHVDSVAGTVVAVHVIEKAGGAPDKASVEQRERDTEEMFDIVRAQLEEYDVDLETEILYGTDVAETIVEAAHEMDASSIVFTPRGGSRWIRLLAGDVALSLISESDLPVVVLPDEPEVEDG
ncbi:universal stress protein [Halapricum hydrolyticum]|uniref:Universal stress protein n=1 Tax=Halapricum hydrolyticum TaxID=2979991 RepID=A0AAE3LDR1_9EURY|nr:universal stress protein [Halapricum hydrolyticum]MCU4717007.1 universal stress protein [Halapricum hydrolyticum]MCU4725387.1 universal stress protein [Halapricum hydrolyticum]